MRTATKIAVGAAVGTLAMTLLASPAAAKGAAVGGSGAQYFLNDTFSGTANTVFTYGDPGDDVYVGDWDGTGGDTLLIRRGNSFFVRNTNSTGPADAVFSYGDAGDTVLVGDWDGNGTDTLAVRRGNTFFVKNDTTTGVADTTFSYGDAGDVVLVGDWDGNGTDTLTVRRGGEYFVKNDLRTGVAERTFFYGDPGDTVLVGRWAADQVGDALGVRRGGTYFLRTSLTSGPATTVFGYGEPTDTAFVGDWNGDGVDTLGVRRVPAPPFGDGTYRVGADVRPGTYRSSAAPDSDCFWARLSGLGGTEDEVITGGIDTPEIVTISSSDVGFATDGCGVWSPVASTYPAAPAAAFGSGTFEVGRHIAAGSYRAPGGADCLWIRLSDFSNEERSFIEVGESTSVTIDATDAGFYSYGCGTWTR